MLTPELDIRELSGRRAVVRASWLEGAGRVGMVTSPVGKTCPTRLTPMEDAGVSIEFPDVADPDFPQFDCSRGEHWSVWPVWRLVPGAAGADVPTKIRLSGRAVPPVLVGQELDLQGDDSCLWLGSGLSRAAFVHDTLPVELESAPESPSVRPLVEGALDVLQHWSHPLPWQRMLVLVELQRPDRGKEKGVAINRGASIWCRAMLRPDSEGRGVRVPGEAVELLVHELLHHLLEAETPAGHLLTEGLITYLARRLAVQGGWLAPDFLEAAAQRSLSELAGEPQRNLTLAQAADQFFVDPSARRVAYRKGFLAMADIDAATGFQLDQLCRTLARRAGARKATGERGQFSEAEFVELLPEPAKQAYANWIAQSDAVAPPRHPTGRP